MKRFYIIEARISKEERLAVYKATSHDEASKMFFEEWKPQNGDSWYILCVTGLCYNANGRCD